MSSSCALNPLNKPCGSCPWRVNQEASDIPNFDLEKAERLRNSSPDINGMGPSYLDPIFACHQSRVGEEFACAGWLAKVGHAHPRIRYLVSTGKLPAEALNPATDWPELHSNYPDVLDKLRETTVE